VRWENLQLGSDSEVARAALPFALPGAVVRRFDTPAFAGMTFYEIRAKSIINRVPSASRVPFEWTINPYRGCSHACVYCLAGDTPILMADGRTRPLAELRVGDEVYGTVRVGTYRHFTTTRVLAHWQTVKPAYRVTLEDGAQIVASGDHRFLSDRGWKYVTGHGQGAGQRPHLTPGTKLLGTGAFAEAPKESADYRRGYLCGFIRGGGHRIGGEGEALRRARQYLADFGPAATGVLAEVAHWPESAGLDWCKGFLGGMFDAKGKQRDRVIRIATADPEVVGLFTVCLRRLGFDAGIDDRRRRGGDQSGVATPSRPGVVTTVRLRGGLPETLRFLLAVDPAVGAKRSIAGHTVKSGARLRVANVEPLGLDLPMFDITTGTGDFIANGVVSHNCFARNTHTYLDLDPGHDFDTQVVVKVNAGVVLRRELAAPKWTGAPIAMGTNVDCYQRAEGKYRLMREIITALRDYANPFSILTKGTLILRDLDLLREASSVTSVGVAMSIGFVNEALWRSVEPGTPSPARRLDAVRQLSDAGFAVGVLMAPILPGLTDTPEEIDRTVAAIAASGAASVTPLALHLRRGAKEWYSAWLAREHPNLLPRYREQYGDRAYLPSSYQRELAARVSLAARRHGLGASAANTVRQPPEHATAEPARPKAVAEQLRLL
jgi:DNA repair photolyase